MLNTRLDCPNHVEVYWPGAVGANIDLTKKQSVSDNHLMHCARGVVVGVNGTLVLRDLQGFSITFTSAMITAMNNVIRGQWREIVAAGSTAHTLTVWW